jgi:hypothetical protein
MTQGIRSALTKLIDMVEAITPKTDVYNGFVCIKNARGGTLSLDNLGLNDRYFDIVLNGLPTDDGAAGISGRKRVPLSVRVRYNPNIDIGYTELLMAEDTSFILNTLKGPEYDLATTGIVSLIPVSSSLQELEQDDTTYYLLNFSFDLLFLEE